MKNLKLYFLLLVLSIVFLIVGFFSTEGTLDINVHDTYYVIAHSFVCWVNSIFLFLLFGIYGLFDLLKIKLNNLFSKSHIIGTIISILGLFFPYYLILPTPDFPLFDENDKIQLCITISAILFVVFQLVFLLNILITLIKKMANIFSKKK